MDLLLKLCGHEGREDKLIHVHHCQRRATQLSISWRRCVIARRFLTPRVHGRHRCSAAKAYQGHSRLSIPPSVSACFNRPHGLGLRHSSPCGQTRQLVRHTTHSATDDANDPRRTQSTASSTPGWKDVTEHASGPSLPRPR